MKNQYESRAVSAETRARAKLVELNSLCRDAKFLVEKNNAKKLIDLVKKETAVRVCEADALELMSAYQMERSR